MKRKKKQNFKEKLLNFYYSNFNNIKIALYFSSILILMLVLIYSNNFTYNIGKFNNQLINTFPIINRQKEPIIEEIEEPKTHISLKINDDGYNVYAPVSGRSGYRYGPSILINDDGSLDAWFASPGNYVEWDWITYAHSDDGINWSDEKIVLQPSGDSMDHYSVCDPGVIYIDGYYYLGYTSTIVATNNGINNNIFVARSKNPDGPYEKWNGNGWGGDPKPMIYYDESNDYWGAGEVSFVEVDNIIYCYYSWYCEHGFFTKVSTAPVGENWPAHLSYRGIVYSNNYGQDSSDVVYLDDYNLFITFAVEQRFSSNSGIVMYESSDGINFKKADIIHTNMSMYAHNMGISKHLNGHINENDDLKIGYAYSNSSSTWGKWATRIQDVDLIIYNDVERKEFDKGGVSTYRSNYSKKQEASYISGIGVDNKKVTLDLNDTYTIKPNSYNQYHNKSSFNGKVTYEYDDSIIDITNNKITALAYGKTEVIMHYKDFYSTFNVEVKEENNEKEIIVFEPIEKDITLYLNNDNYHNVQIRAYVEFSNGSWGEAYNDYTKDHRKYKAMIDADKYYMEYKPFDTSIIKIDNKGIITPIKTGSTKVLVTITGGLSFEVNVTVK